MNFTNEMIEKAKTAASAEELLAMAKAEGVELTAEEAAQYFDFLKTGAAELNDAELDQVAGGKGGKKDPDPKYNPGQRVAIYYETSMNTIHGTIESRKSYRAYDEARTLVYQYRVFIEEYGYAITIELEHFGKNVQVI